MIPRPLPALSSVLPVSALPVSALLLALPACAPEDGKQATGDDTAAGTTDPRPEPAAITEISDGECPAIEARASTFSSGGASRSVAIYAPDPVPEGLPVLFYWHPLGGSASQMASYLDLPGWAEEHQIMVIAPNASADNMFEWDFWNNQDDDLILYDDLRACASQEWGVDLSRVYSSGMSAGALWTSFLSTRRGDTLAALLPFSGGSGDLWQYQTPGSQFPAVLPYGGDTDTWGGSGITVDFQEATLEFAAQLEGDGHPVILCNHEGGHTLPRETMDITTAFLLPQVYGQDPAGFDKDAMLALLPDYCYTGL